MTNEKRAGRVAQVAECLPSKCKALSSDPKYCRNIKKKIKLEHITAWHKFSKSFPFYSEQNLHSPPQFM
jgi:hypothetical protein